MLQSSGEARGNGILRDAAAQSSTVSDNMKTSYSALASGYGKVPFYLILNFYQLNNCSGFACFLFMIAFVLLFASAIYVSPAACGSANEKLTVKKPLDLKASTFSSV